MADITIRLSDADRENAQRLAAAAGHADLAEYVKSLVQADLASRRDRIAESSFDTDERLESLLLAGMQGGTSREMTDADWEAKRQRLIERHQRSGAA